MKMIVFFKLFLKNKKQEKKTPNTLWSNYILADQEKQTKSVWLACKLIIRFVIRQQHWWNSEEVAAFKKIV